jgi:large conductance mechanosensitive channel
MIKEFTEFVREKGVIGLAVGIVVGGAITKIVASTVDSFINPLVGWVTGAAGNLTTMSYTVPLTTITFKYGAFISSLIDFLSVMAVVYLVFVKSPINKLDRKDEEK